MKRMTSLSPPLRSCRRTSTVLSPFTRWWSACRKIDGKRLHLSGTYCIILKADRAELRCFAYRCRSRAWAACEPCQAGNRAALSGACTVPRSSLHLYAKQRSRVLCPLYLYLNGRWADVPRLIPQMAPPALCRCCRPDSHRHSPAKPDRSGPHRPCVSVHRTRGTGKTTLRQDLRQGGQLSGYLQP